ncbi:DUF1934 domain-containing protein [Staphylococcus edaphicus]|uniref:DUF1934 family protein n=1 Tax=Staphylococcus edaphicus TaxID=1955013 RepID=A0A2C6WQX1_9STAP|nr:DUF1934 family protein [Staphylococcus edaphicus]PHK50485.1 hypothetical protein BTJ66_03265 [Staphylococcus edaphicus]UQW81170.1 DUF1934 family protein [Staphylococcus edaphicus]
MENNVNIQTKQVVKQFDNKEKFTTNTQGTWQKRNAEFIRYQENIDDVVVNVTVKIEETGVKIIRKGEIKMNLHFVEGEDTITLYEITGGRIPLTVRTHSILHFVTEHGGKLKVHYDLIQDEEKMGSYQYEITYKEQS